MENKTCSICGKEFPRDKDHFRYRIQNGKGYFTAECLACIAKAKKASRLRKQAKQKESMDKIEEAGVNLFLKSVASGGSNIPHTAEVVEKVMDYFGGVGGFSAVLVKQYWDAQPGGSQRNRLLETMCRLVTRNVETGGAKKPLQLWSEEELEEELEKRIAEVAADYKGLTIDATTQTPEGLPAPSPEETIAHAVPEAIAEGFAERDQGAAAGGTEALQAESESGEDSLNESE
jgi:hypothetical protein